jgi:hypothetical protein
MNEYNFRFKVLFFLFSCCLTVDKCIHRGVTP